MPSKVDAGGNADAGDDDDDVELDANGEADAFESQKEHHQYIMRIPSVLASFLVRTCQILNNPLDPMYKAVSNFLLAKPLLSVFSVPEFLRLFHSKDPLQHDVEREWMVAVLRDGLRDDLSYSVMQQNFVFKMVLSFHDSSLAQLVISSSAYDPSGPYSVIAEFSLELKLKSCPALGFWVFSQRVPHENARMIFR